MVCSYLIDQHCYPHAMGWLYIAVFCREERCQEGELSQDLILRDPAAFCI